MIAIAYSIARAIVKTASVQILGAKARAYSTATQHVAARKISSVAITVPVAKGQVAAVVEAAFSRIRRLAKLAAEELAPILEELHRNSGDA